jgi:hypothetical protein
MSLRVQVWECENLTGKAKRGNGFECNLYNHIKSFQTFLISVFSLNVWYHTVRGHVSLLQVT